MCEMNSHFILQIIFGSIPDIYHWHSDFMLHHHIFRDFLVTVLRIFGVSFVRGLPAKYDSARTQLEVELRKIVAFCQVRANENRLCQVFRSQILLRQLSYVKLIDEI